MGQYRHNHIFWNAAYCVLVFCTVDFRPLLLGGLFKLVVTLAVACLLAFVVVHSASICRAIAACLHALPASHFALTVDRRWAGRLQTTVVVPNEPSLSPLFQRPPPASSL
jgi:hypothetical protein